MADDEELTEGDKPSDRSSRRTSEAPARTEHESGRQAEDTTPDPSPEPGASPGDPAERAAAGESASADQPDPDTASAGRDSLDERSPGALHRIIQHLQPADRNRFVAGTLTVHYASRDVNYQMDGESGLRMLNVLAGASADIDLVTRDSDALRTWIMIDRTDVLGAQWTPGDSIVPRRPTMDPAGLVDAVA